MNETVTSNFASEIINMKVKLDQNPLQSPNNNYEINTDVLGKGNCKHIS